jgi:hypothetical protein
MWKWFGCYLSGRHEFGVWCEPGAVFLRCIHCGRRSSGWAVDEALPGTSAVNHAATSSKAATAAPTRSRVVAFNRSVAN